MKLQGTPKLRIIMVVVAVYRFPWYFSNQNREESKAINRQKTN